MGEVAGWEDKEEEILTIAKGVSSVEELPLFPTPVADGPSGHKSAARSGLADTV